MTFLDLVTTFEKVKIRIFGAHLLPPPDIFVCFFLIIFPPRVTKNGQFTVFNIFILYYNYRLFFMCNTIVSSKGQKTPKKISENIYRFILIILYIFK